MAKPRTEHPHLWLLDTDEDADTGLFTLTCEFDGYPGWLIIAETVPTERGRELRRVTVEPAREMPDGGITTRMLLRLRTGELLKAGRIAVRQHQLPDEPVKRTGRRGHDPLWYAQVAQAYAAAVTASPHPVAEIAARESLSQSQVRNLVYECRSRGMLTAAPPGRAGGKLTDKALKLLREDRHGKHR